MIYRDKLKEASEVYKKDKETIDWFVMQDPTGAFITIRDPFMSKVDFWCTDATKFCIVERYEQESSQQYHLNNPYW